MDFQIFKKRENGKVKFRFKFFKYGLRSNNKIFITLKSMLCYVIYI